MTLFDAHLRAELAALAARGLLREPLEVPPGALVLCSNDYLGYAREPLPSEHTPPASGSGASRLVSGDHELHRAAEADIAAWLGHETALLVSSGYAANVGAIPALTGAGDVVISDAQNHASIIDGCRLGRAETVVVPHGDLDAVARALARAGSARSRWLVTESYFSMDGDVAPLAELRALADAHDAFLVVDEAHALGVFGAEGRGLCHRAGVTADVLIGTLGKALGLAGAFIAGSHALRALLWNRARSFVFSTGIPPWLAGAASQRIARLRADDLGRQRLQAIVEHVRSALEALGAPIAPSVGPILPWVVGDPRHTLALRDELLTHGVFCQAIRPPTVPTDSSRLRITLHASLQDAELERALAAFAACVAPPPRSTPRS